MLYQEKLRNLDDEALLIDYITLEYSHAGAMYDYDDSLGQQTLTLAEDTDVVISVVFWGSNCHGCGFIEVDGDDVASTGTQAFTATEVPLRWMGRLAAGVHTIHFPVSIFYNSASPYNVKFSKIRIGKVSIQDTTPVLVSDSFTAAHGVTDGDAYYITITAPAARTLAYGTMKKYMLFGQLNLRVNHDSRQIEFLDVGEAATGGIAAQIHYAEGASAPAVNVGLRNWGTHHDSYNATSSGTNPTYEGGANAWFFIPVECGQQITLAIQTTNTLAADKTVLLRMSYMFSPWIAGNYECECVAFDKATLQSTVHAVIEPLLADASGKYIKIGHEKVTDLSPYYYASSTGTGIISASFTFDTIVPDCSSLFTYGEGAVVSFVAMDVR